MYHSANEAIKSAIAKRSWNVGRRFGITAKRVTSTLGSYRLTKEQVSVLEIMRQDNSRSPPPYKAGPIWISLAEQFEDWFALEGIEEVEAQKMNGFFSSPFPGDQKLLRYACWLLYRQILGRDYLHLLDKIPATVSIGTGLAFLFDGKLVSWDLLISIDSFYSMAELDPRIINEAVIIAEIGAGWGRMGYVIKKTNPLATYVVLDLPETLLVSQTHLPKRLPGERILDYRSARKMQLSRNTLQDWGCVFLGAHDIARIEDGALDWVINIASFQEMSKEQVQKYFAVIDQKSAGYLYIQQLKNAEVHGYDVGEISGQSAYPFPSSWTEVFSRDSSWSDLYFDMVLQVGSRKFEV